LRSRLGPSDRLLRRDVADLIVEERERMKRLLREMLEKLLVI
jgi:hypothetical protein